MYQEITVPAHRTRAILGGAMTVSCKDDPVTLKARLCPSDDFNEIASELAEVYGPMVDVHVHPSGNLPSGVEIGIKHFLDVPRSLGAKESLEKDGHSH